MYTALWIAGAILLAWGTRTDGLKDTIWAVVGIAISLAIMFGLLLMLLNPTGAIILVTATIAAGTWRLMWWLTDRGHI